MDRRIELLAEIPPEPLGAMELSDGYAMASEVFLAAGDLGRAAHFADETANLPFHREAPHLATARRLKVDLLAGDIDAVVAASQRFHDGWERAGRPVAGNLAASAYAVAAAHGIAGDDESRAAWLKIAAALSPIEGRHEDCDSGYAPVLDALVALHHDDAAAAVTRLSADPEEFTEWYRGIWKPWYAALWAEAAVLADHPEASARIDRSRLIVGANPIAAAVVERAAAILTGDRPGVATFAAALDDTVCRYQSDRTRVLTDGNGPA